MPRVNIGVVIVNWKREESTTEFVDSLKKLKLPKWTRLHKIIIDNESKGKLKRSNLGKSSQINIVEVKENLGFAGGYNIGIKEALKKGCQFILLINNDTLIGDPDLLLKFLQVFKKHKKVGAITSKIYFAKGYEFHKNRYHQNEKGKVIWYAGGFIDWENVFSTHRGIDEVDNGNYNKTEETKFISGCLMFIPAKVFKKIGLLDESLFAYFEDADFCLRIIAAELKLIYVGNTFIWHKVAQSSGGSGSDICDYYITRNRLAFGMKYAPLKTKISLLKEVGKIMLQGRKYQKLGVKDFFLHKLGKGDYDFS